MDQTVNEGRGRLRSCTYVLLVVDCNLWETGHVVGFTLSFSIKRHLSIWKAQHSSKGGIGTRFWMHRGVMLQLKALDDWIRCVSNVF